MDVNVLIQLISSLGFPIVACGALFWRMVKSDEQHVEEMNKMSEALNNNTLVMEQIKEVLTDGERK